MLNQTEIRYQRLIKKDNYDVVIDDYIEPSVLITREIKNKEGVPACSCAVHTHVAEMAIFLLIYFINISAYISPFLFYRYYENVLQSEGTQ